MCIRDRCKSRLNLKNLGTSDILISLKISNELSSLFLLIMINFNYLRSILLVKQYKNRILMNQHIKIYPIIPLKLNLILWNQYRPFSKRNPINQNTLLQIQDINPWVLKMNVNHFNRNVIPSVYKPVFYILLILVYLIFILRVVSTFSIVFDIFRFVFKYNQSFVLI